MANGRSDVIVLIHISSDRKKVYLVHFPRDMYVNVPGHGKDKINAAFAYGGAPLLVQTLPWWSSMASLRRLEGRGVQPDTQT